jgi:hypothetical protein
MTLMLEDRTKMYVINSVGNNLVLQWVYVEQIKDPSMHDTEYHDGDYKLYQTLEDHAGYFGGKGRKHYDDREITSINKDFLIDRMKTRRLRDMNSYLEALRVTRESYNQIANITEEVHEQIQNPTA